MQNRPGSKNVPTKNKNWKSYFIILGMEDEKKLHPMLQSLWRFVPTSPGKEDCGIVKKE
jgi:hypothetical protein